MAVGLVDQGVSSATNFGGTLVAARQLSAGGFGLFAVVAAVYAVAVAASRGLVSEPVVVRSRWSSSAKREHEQAFGAALVTGVGLGLLTLIVGLGIGGSAGRCLVLLAVLLPCLVGQDFVRLTSMASSAPARAVISDLIWLAVQTAAVGWLLPTDRAGWSPAGAVAAWLVPGAIAGIATALIFRIRPRFVSSGRWIVKNSDIGWRLALDNILSQSTGMLLIFAVALVADSSQVGYLRLAQTAFGPLVVAVAGLRLALVPELVRRRERSGDDFVSLTRLTAVALAGLAVIWTLALYFAPERVLVSVFGSGWPNAHALVPWIGISIAAGGVTTAAYLGIRALADARASLRTIVRVSALNLAAGMIGMAAGGALGASVALAFSVPVTTAVWVVRLRRSWSGFKRENAVVLPDCL